MSVVFLEKGDFYQVDFPLNDKDAAQGIIQLSDGFRNVEFRVNPNPFDKNQPLFKKMQTLFSEGAKLDSIRAINRYFTYYQDSFFELEQQNMVAFLYGLEKKNFSNFLGLINLKFWEETQRRGSIIDQVKNKVFNRDNNCKRRRSLF